MRVTIFGSRGYLGSEFHRLYPDADVPNVDITDTQQVGLSLDAFQPHVVINAAGRTGEKSVDWCEDNQLATLHSNVTGPLVLLKECVSRETLLVHIGTGCVYSGDNDGVGYSEDDPPNFTGSFYSRTKAWVDQVLADFPVLIVRPRMPFDASDHPRNLINKLRTYPKLINTPNSMTCLPDMLAATQQLIQQRATGIYNLCNPGSCSPCDVMEAYRQYVDPDHQFEAMDLASLTKIVKADRSNCILSSRKLETAGIVMRPVAEALADTMQQIASRQS